MFSCIRVLKVSPGLKLVFHVSCGGVLLLKRLLRVEYQVRKFFFHGTLFSHVSGCKYLINVKKEFNNKVFLDKEKTAQPKKAPCFRYILLLNSPNP